MTNKPALPKSAPPHRHRLFLPKLLVAAALAVIVAGSVLQRSLAARAGAALLDALAGDPDTVVSVDDVRVSLVGRRIEVRGLRLGDSDGRRFARVTRGMVRFGLGSLRRGVVEIPRVVLEGLDVRIDSIVLAAFRSEGGGGGPGPLTPANRGSRFVMRRIDVRDARIVLLDDQGREQFAGRVEEVRLDDLGTREHPLSWDDVVRLATARILEAAGLSGAERRRRPE